MQSCCLICLHNRWNNYYNWDSRAFIDVKWMRCSQSDIWTTFEMEHLKPVKSFAFIKVANVCLWSGYPNCQSLWWSTCEIRIWVLIKFWYSSLLGWEANAGNCIQMWIHQYDERHSVERSSNEHRERSSGSLKLEGWNKVKGRTNQVEYSRFVSWVLLG